MMLEKPKKMETVIRAASAALGKCSLTFKTRMAYTDKSRVAHTFAPKVAEWGAAAMTLHGRTRPERGGLGVHQINKRVELGTFDR
jgi:tRNA-dihydrouridine synthase 3